MYTAILSHNAEYFQPKWLCLEMCLLKSCGLCFVVAFSHLRQLYKYAIKKKGSKQGQSNSDKSRGTVLAIGSLPGGILENANVHCVDLEGKSFENRSPFPL